MATLSLTLPRHVVSRAFAAETVLLNINTGQYHSLDPVAGRMFELLAETGDETAALARLRTEYDAPGETIEQDLRTLVAELLSRGLLERSEARTG